MDQALEFNYLWWKGEINHNNLNLLNIKSIRNTNKSYTDLIIELNKYIITLDSQENILLKENADMNPLFAQFISNRDDIDIDYLMKRKVKELYQVPYIEAIVKNEDIEKLLKLEDINVAVHSDDIKENKLMKTCGSVIRLTYMKLDDDNYLFPSNYIRNKNIFTNKYPNTSVVMFIGKCHNTDINQIFKKIIDTLK